MRLPIILFLVGISASTLLAQKDIQKRIQTQLIEAEDNSTVEIPEGTFQFDASLSLDGKKNVIIKNKSRDMKPYECEQPPIAPVVLSMK